MLTPPLQAHATMLHYQGEVETENGIKTFFFFHVENVLAPDASRAEKLTSGIPNIFIIPYENKSTGTYGSCGIIFLQGGTAPWKNAL